MAKAKAKKSTTAPPWESETASPPPAEKTAKRKHVVNIHCLGSEVTLRFPSEREANTARLSIAERCARGAPAYIVCGSKTYSFVPNFGYLVTENG